MLVYRLKNPEDSGAKKIRVKDLKTHEVVDTVIVRDVTKLNELVTKLHIDEDRFYVDTGSVM